MNNFLGLAHGWCWISGVVVFVAGYIAGRLRETYKEIELAAGKTEECNKAEPETGFIFVGSLWKFRLDPGDPFPNTRPVAATVLEVRDGWVRYKIVNCSGDNRRTLKSFLHCYEPA